MHAHPLLMQLDPDRRAPDRFEAARTQLDAGHDDNLLPTPPAPKRPKKTRFSRLAKLRARLIKRKMRKTVRRAAHSIEELGKKNPLVRNHFDDGGKTIYNYLRTHRNKYTRHVGAHFIMNLYEAGPDVLADFATKQREHGWHFRLTLQELEALWKAREETCMYSRISNVRYTTNVFSQLTNRKQLMRMLGLGAAAGSAGILLGLGELFFFAKQWSQDLLETWFGVSFTRDTSSETNDEFVDLANRITDGAVNPDGSLDAEIVARGIADLVESLEDAGDAETAVSYMNADIGYILGILTGIILLVIGRGVAQLIKEGFTGAVTKIDAIIDDMDDYCNWKLGRHPRPSDIDPSRLDPAIRGDARARRQDYPSYTGIHDDTDGGDDD